MTLQPDAPTGTPAERNGNGALGAPRGADPASSAGSTIASTPVPGGSSVGGNGGPTGAGTFPEPMSSDLPGAPRVAWRPAEERSRSEFGAFLDDLSQIARGGSDSSELRDEIERRIEQARARMGVALDQGRELSSLARDQMQRGLEVSREAVVERPLSYLALAAVGGLLVGLLLARRD